MRESSSKAMVNRAANCGRRLKAGERIDTHETRMRHASRYYFRGKGGRMQQPVGYETLLFVFCVLLFCYCLLSFSLCFAVCDNGMLITWLVDRKINQYHSGRKHDDLLHVNIYLENCLHSRPERYRVHCTDTGRRLTLVSKTNDFMRNATHTYTCSLKIIDELACTSARIQEAGLR